MNLRRGKLSSRNPARRGRGGHNLPRRGLRRDGLHQGGDVGLWKSLRQELLDLGLAPVCGRRDQLPYVLLGEMGSQQTHGGQMETAIGQGGEQDGKLACASRCLDAFEGGVFGQMQLFDATGIHGREASREIKPSRIDFGYMSYQGSCVGSIPRHERREIAQQDVIAEMG